ncbi:uncharacterized protein LOC108481326 [Gossypium arboreum]|uniref:DUF241 domain protein n=2 Tax=Gossypium TaxID=3633 RepID=A0ABR0QYD7_GOSAR|nr:uncharacterized protein LOC108481326 [Gossypium arboreum]KAK5843878.1 hypothetical protein PVK06_000013 [Gossypium arboreum]
MKIPHTSPDIYNIHMAKTAITALNPIMATSHARSISLPSRSNPKILQIQELLFRLKPVEIVSLSMSEMSNKLGGVRDLLEIFNELLLLSQTQQALLRGCNEKWADDLLDGLVLLLDVCGIAKDVFLQSKEHIRGLRSMFRRRKADEFDLTKEISHYLASRKKSNKLIHKVSKDLNTKRSCSTSYSKAGNDNTMATADMSRQIQHVVLTTLKSLLLYITGFKTQTKVGRWSLVSNLIRSKHVDRNEFEKVDDALNVLLDHKAEKHSNQNLQTELGKLELSFEDVEQQLERLHRDLIKTRVTLLNILSH